MKTEHVKVRHIVRDRDEACLQILGIVEVEKLAARELRNRFRRICTQRTARRQKSHGRQPKGRRKLADAVQHLLAVMPFVLGIRSFPAEATMCRARLRIVELRSLMTDRRTCAGKTKTVQGGVRIADQSKRVGCSGHAALVDRFAK